MQHHANTIFLCNVTCTGHDTVQTRDILQHVNIYSIMDIWPLIIVCRSWNCFLMLSFGSLFFACHGTNPLHIGACNVTNTGQFNKNIK